MTKLEIGIARDAKNDKLHIYTELFVMAVDHDGNVSDFDDSAKVETDIGVTIQALVVNFLKAYQQQNGSLNGLEHAQFQYATTSPNGTS